ncbi:hypothetical protein A73_34 [Escherichia phage A73]|uniref:Uncharacterized protein n=1 Tax=Escherichia phage A73 TaxID=3003819 RepID=A0AAE9W558_9CAUD|nr:hypothetical protein A73_34 [Escherichia phage A73]
MMIKVIALTTLLCIPFLAHGTKFYGANLIDCKAHMLDHETGNKFVKPFQINPAAFSDGVLYQEGKASTLIIHYDPATKKGSLSIQIEGAEEFSGKIICN